MEFAKTKNTGIAFDPFIVRPGTLCRVTIKYSNLNTYEWDVSTIFGPIIIDGFLTKKSIQMNEEINSDNIILETLSDGTTQVTIIPISTLSQIKVLNIYYMSKETNIVNSIPAIGKIRITESVIINEDMVATVSHEIANIHSVSETYITPAKYFKTIQLTSGAPEDQVMIDYDYYSEYYKDYDIKYGKVIPSTIVEPAFHDAIRPCSLDDIIIEPIRETNGVCYVDNNKWQMYNTGLISVGVNVARIGVTETVIPLDSDISPLKFEKDSNGIKIKKIINIDDQRTSSDITFYGIVCVDETIYITTSNGLYAYDKWGNYIDYKFHHPEIIGTDITYLPDDSLAVASGMIVNQYHIRHDFAYIDSPNERIYLRELDPDIEINGVPLCD